MRRPFFRAFSRASWQSNVVVVLSLAFVLFDPQGVL